MLLCLKNPSKLFISIMLIFVVILIISYIGCPELHEFVDIFDTHQCAGKISIAIGTLLLSIATHLVCKYIVRFCHTQDDDVHIDLLH
jgi:hypothetical protein